MAMVTAGLLNKQIAGELNLSEITVKMHRRQVMEKMQAGSLADLVKVCERAKEPSWPGRRTNRAILTGNSLYVPYFELI